MNADLDALATALYVTIDDLLKEHPDWQPERPAIGIAPQLTGAELITLAVIQALLGYTSERRFIRYAHLHQWFPFLPQRATNNNKRLRAARQHDPTRHHRHRPQQPELHRRHLARRLHPRRVRPFP